MPRLRKLYGYTRAEVIGHKLPTIPAEKQHEMQMLLTQASIGAEDGRCSTASGFPKQCVVLKPASQWSLAISAIPLEWPESTQAELPLLWG